MTLEEIKQKYKEYVEREWGEDAVQELVNEDETLDLMYTTINDDEVEVQVSYNTKTTILSVRLSFGNKSYIFETHSTFDEIYETLEYASFDMFYSYAHQVCEERFSLDLEW